MSLGKVTSLRWEQSSTKGQYLINEQIGVGIDNVELLVRVSQVIDDPRTPTGVRLYVNTYLQI